MSSNRLCLSLVLFSFIFSYFASARAFAGRANKVVSSKYNKLIREEKRLINEIKNSGALVNQAKYMAGFLENFQDSLRANDIDFVRRNMNAVVMRVKTPQIKAMLRKFLYSIDGTQAVTLDEKNGYLELCNGLNDIIGSPRKNSHLLRKVRISLMPLIPPHTIRKMKRNAASLMRKSRKEQRLIGKINELQEARDKEYAFCKESPVRSKVAYRNLSGHLSLNKKKLEMCKASKVFAETLLDVISDGQLFTEEKHELVKVQSVYARLEASLELLSKL